MLDWFCWLTGDIFLRKREDGRRVCLCGRCVIGVAYQEEEYQRHSVEIYRWMYWKRRLCGLFRHKILLNHNLSPRPSEIIRTCMCMLREYKAVI